mmetsp:Transcript_18900/g.54470  ORF Transcript_18900/g.54470 Transcript_18900/m.54470 type:complete len:215 (+) Transcript_18900:24-668(+)
MPDDKKIIPHKPARSTSSLLPCSLVSLSALSLLLLQLLIVNLSRRTHANPTTLAHLHRRVPTLLILTPPCTSNAASSTMVNGCATKCHAGLVLCGIKRSSDVSMTAMEVAAIHAPMSPPTASTIMATAMETTSTSSFSATTLVAASSRTAHRELCGPRNSSPASTIAATFLVARILVPMLWQGASRRLDTNSMSASTFSAMPTPAATFNPVEKI